jgi:hypothetical protein
MVQMGQKASFYRASVTSGFPLIPDISLRRRSGSG